MTIVPDFDRAGNVPIEVATRDRSTRADATGGTSTYWAMKGVVDVLGALVLLPVVALLAVVLMVLNPLFNPGPLVFRQVRMGRDCRAFTVYKFRTMRSGGPPRGPDAPVESDRITPLGRVLRRTGLDELPQVFNILRGEMSLIGPRPDCLNHARAFIASVPGYHRRFSVRPGLSGLAQVSLGYTVGAQATRAKARLDLDYIARASWHLDLRIAWFTIISILTGRGD